MLGLVGGLSSIVWGFLYLSLGGYQEFKLQNSLISNTFPTSRASQNTAFRVNANESKAMQEKRAKRALLGTVAERGRYNYGYFQMLYA